MLPQRQLVPDNIMPFAELVAGLVPGAHKLKAQSLVELHARIVGKRDGGEARARAAHSPDKMP